MPNRAAELRKEACDQSDKGWVAQPCPVGEQGSTLTYREKGIGAAFRFAVIQGDKIRAFGDLRHFLTNRACDVLTPVKLVSLYRVAQIRNLVATRGLECESHMADQRGAYKSFPVCPIRTQLSIAVLKNHSNGKWYDFTSVTVFPGSIASVIRYNILPRAISELGGGGGGYLWYPDGVLFQ